MKKIIAILALATVGITTVNAGVHFGINIGFPVPTPVVVAPAPVVVAPAPVVVPPPMPAPVVEAVPACPTPGYVWINGSWGWCDNQWVWTRGYRGPPTYWAHATHWDHGYRAEHGEAF